MHSGAQISLSQKMWRSSLVIAFGVYLFFVFYIFEYDQHFTLASLAKTFAGTANFLFAFSLSLSSFGYFFNFLDSKVAYRKYFGLLGYYSSLVYTCLLPITNPERYWYGFVENFFSSDFLLGLSAMLIFTGMALISRDTMMLKIGPQRWRFFLRFGYLAFFLLVLRAALNESQPIGSDGVPEMWTAYLANPEQLPPPRLLFSVVAMTVLFFRFAVSFDKWRHLKKVPQPAV